MSGSVILLIYNNFSNKLNHKVFLGQHFVRIENRDGVEIGWGCKTVVVSPSMDVSNLVVIL